VTDPDSDLEIEAFLAHQQKLRERPAAEPMPAPAMIPEFACFDCGRQFRRSDCNARDNQTKFGSVRRCPFCKSDRIYAQYDILSEEKSAQKYSPDAEQQIGGLRENKHFTQQQLSAGRSGRMQRKK
jgi:hypothetical protein